MVKITFLKGEMMDKLNGRIMGPGIVGILVLMILQTVLPYVGSDKDAEMRHTPEIGPATLLTAIHENKAVIQETKTTSVQSIDAIKQLTAELRQLTVATQSLTQQVTAVVEKAERMERLRERMQNAKP